MQVISRPICVTQFKLGEVFEAMAFFTRMNFILQDDNGQLQHEGFTPSQVSTSSRMGFIEIEGILWGCRVLEPNRDELEVKIKVPLIGGMPNLEILNSR
jgi:hypothetical protein